MSKNKKITVTELKEAQNELMDSLILNTDEIDRVLNVFQTKMASFHRYSINNIIGCEIQLSKQTNGKEHVELLGSYKQWQTVGRFVKRGSRGLKILVPIKVKNKNYNAEDPENDEPEFITRFKVGNTFNLSQTDGEELIKQEVTGGNIKFEDLVANLNIPVIMVSSELTRGWTDGSKIAVSNKLDDGNKCSTLFHELFHYHKHYTRVDGEVKQTDESTHIKEVFAEAGAYLLSKYCGFDNKKSELYIRNWTGNAEDIEGMGKELIGLAFKIIKELRIDELLSEEVNEN